MKYTKKCEFSQNKLRVFQSFRENKQNFAKIYSWCEAP